MFEYALIGLLALLFVAVVVRALLQGGRRNRYSRHHRSQAARINRRTTTATTEQQTQRKEPQREFDTIEQAPATKQIELEETINSAEEQVNEVVEPERPKLITLYLMAKPPQQLAGYELLQSLLSAGLRFGERNIFHFYSEKQGQRAIQFSLASISEPGIFDIENMGAFRSKGLVLFLQLNRRESMLDAFDQMVCVARQLAEDLDAEFWSAIDEPVNMDFLTETRRQLRAYDSTVETRDLFAEQEGV